MSSLFTVAEIELATRALHLLDGDDLDVVVGGLGLGYTAAAALEDPRVRSLIVVERLAPVIQWHERRLVPSPSVLRPDRLVNEDFFALAAASGFDPDSPDRRFDAILLDVDHSPRHLLSPAHADLYTPTEPACSRIACTRGVFALWSNDPPDPEYVGTLQTAFADVRAEVVEFDNPLQGSRRARGSPGALPASSSSAWPPSSSGTSVGSSPRPSRPPRGHGSSTRTSSPSPPRAASTRTPPTAGSTPSSSTSTTPARHLLSPAARRTSTPPTEPRLAREPPAPRSGSSPCGRTIRPIPSTWALSSRRSPHVRAEVVEFENPLQGRPVDEHRLPAGARPGHQDVRDDHRAP